mgnify:CR=1 FL=1
MEFKLGNKKDSHQLKFWELIDYNISFDFLIGNFLNVFNRKMWKDNLHHLDQDLVRDTRTWSNFDNTCFNGKVISTVFKDKKS